jgi:predicted amidohydrolase
MTSFRIALVQPITVPPPDDEQNVAAAIEWISRAAREGADFVCFPENYPGPWRMPASFDPSPAIAEAAAKHDIHAVFSTLEPIDTAKATAYNLTCMAFPDGGSIPAASIGNSSMSPAATIRSSTPVTARSGWRCAARSICRR